MANIDGWLARKYQIQEEQADTAQRLGLANAGAIEQQTRLAPAEARARNYAAYGAGAGSFGSANLSNTNASLAPGLAASEIAQRYAGIDFTGAQAGAVRQGDALSELLGGEYWERKTLGGTTPPDTTGGGGGSRTQSYLGGAPGGGGPIVPGVGGGFTNGPGAGGGGFSRGGGGTITGPFQGSGNGIEVQSSLGHSMGATRINAPGDGTVDTQPAELADGEAVLNKGAAEHLGRSTIALLNAIGAVKMGLTVGDARGDGAKGDKSPSRVQAQEGGTPGYAWGTPSVGGPPAPGQTVTSGSWDPAEAAAQAQAGGTPPPPIQVQTPASGATFGKRKTPPVAGYAKGTSRVSVKGSPKASPGKGSPQGGGEGLTPQVIQAILGMSGGMGGRGMPPPNVQPMPMPMPSTGGR